MTAIRFGSGAAELLSRGYIPLPVNGKKIFKEGWQNATKDASSDWLKDPQNKTLNIGILTGKGDVPLFAADFDFYDPDVAQDVSQAFVRRFGEGLVRHGQAPKLLVLYRGIDPHTKITSKKWVDTNNPIKSDGQPLDQGFELLGSGQQFVAFGAHPLTGLDYSWDDLSPLDIAASDLNFIDPEEVRRWVTDELPTLLPANYVTKSADNNRASEGKYDELHDLADVDHETLADLASAIDHFTSTDADDYDLWISVGQSLKTLANRGFAEEANNLFHRFAAKSDKYGHSECEDKWVGFAADRTSFRAVFSKAAQRGWVNPKSNEARREKQRQQNRLIGEGEVVTANNEVLNLEEMLDRFVFQASGQYLSDRKFPHACLKLADARAVYAASRMKKVITKADGSQQVREVECLDEFMRSPERPTTYTRTFIAGGEQIVMNDDGLKCFNTFTPFNRIKADQLDDSSLAEPFIEHVRWLFGDRTEDFLDWLAHIEQFPGTLPHTAWLHIANQTGLGRNWISSVLVRLWPSYVASNFNLVESLKSGFNGMLSHKLLAQVDELNEANQITGKWQFAEQLKQILNCEYRNINTKYGLQTRERNACRFLLFSNHTSAIPLDKEDRRIEVVTCKETPRSEEYYSELYQLVGDAWFIASVAKFLRERDIRNFNPGKRALFSADKDSIVSLNQTPADETAKSLVDWWPYDLIPTPFVHEALGINTAGIQHVKDRAGITAFIAFGHDKAKPIKLHKKAVRVSVLRNHDKWANTSIEDAKSILEQSTDLFERIKSGIDFSGVSLRDYLDGLQADASSL